MQRAAIAFVSLALVNCQTPETSEVPVGEEAEAAVKAPTSAPIGSLGGICGKQWSACQSEEKIKKTFGSGLKRSSVKASSKRQGDQLVESVKFQVPRLVNDHSESKDNIEVVYRGRDQEYGTMQVKRNGMVVHEAQYYGNEAAETNFLETDRGGVEASLAFFGDLAFVQAQNRALQRAFIADCGGQQSKGCYFTKTTLLVGLAALGSYGAAALAEGVGGSAAAATHLRGLATGTAAIYSVNWDCKSDDKVQADKCTDSYCSCKKSSSGSGCMDSLNACCKAAGGTVRTGRTANPEPFCEAPSL